MFENRPYCLSVAGYDPCGGAGILADIKTFEQNEVQGIAAITAITWQNDECFNGMKWLSWKELLCQLEPLQKYPVRAIKIGLIKDMDYLKTLLQWIKNSFPVAKIIWDPVLKATAGFSFHNGIFIDEDVLKLIDLVTPNLYEYRELFQKGSSTHVGAVLVKGGHGGQNTGSDILIESEKETEIVGEVFKDKVDKHGTGCVLSSAIAAALAKGNTLKQACSIGKNYVEKFIKSNKENLGYHNI